MKMTRINKPAASAGQSDRKSASGGVLNPSTRIKKAALFFLCLALYSCVTPPETADDKAALSVPGAESGEERPDYITILAAGDNLYHDVMIRAGEKGDYESAYSEIRPLIEKADIAFINQETLLAGEDFGFSGYPRFNSPKKLGRALAALGFDAVNHATNHIMDKGEKAVFATINFWDSLPAVSVLGIHRSEKERSRPKLISKNNISVGFLSYTYGTNGLDLPADKPYMVSLIDTEIMAKEIGALRPLCDVLVVSMHWGEEYRHEINETQKKLAAFLAEKKVDIVLGHHPHVIQPVEYIPRPDGKTMLCFYSLGNFISAQMRAPTLVGAMAYIRIQKMPLKGGKVSTEIIFTDAGAIPTVNHFEKNYTNFQIYPLYAYSEELLDAHRINLPKKEITMNYLSGLSAKILGGKEILHDPLSRP